MVPATCTKRCCPHWEGYQGSSPVRIGNGAADQLQLDIYGEAIDSLYFANQHGLVGGHQGWRRLCDILAWLTDNWNQPEEGIWETRGRPAGVHVRTVDELGGV